MRLEIIALGQVDGLALIGARGIVARKVHHVAIFVDDRDHAQLRDAGFAVLDQVEYCRRAHLFAQFSDSRHPRIGNTFGDRAQYKVDRQKTLFDVKSDRL